MLSVGIERLSLEEIRRVAPIPPVTARLLRCVKHHQLLEPVVVRPLPGGNGYSVLAHPEVVVAAGRLGIHRLAVLVRDDLDEEEAAAAIRARYGAQDNDAIAEAENFQSRLNQPGSRKLSKASLARLHDKSRTYVSRSLSLLGLPGEVKEAIRNGRLSAGHAHELVPLDDPRQQQRLAGAVIAGDLSVRALRQLIKNGLSKPKAAARKDPDVQRLEGRLSELLGSTVRIDAEAGHLIVDYFGDHAILQGILSRWGYRG